MRTALRDHNVGLDEPEPASQSLVTHFSGKSRQIVSDSLMGTPLAQVPNMPRGLQLRRSPMFAPSQHRNSVAQAMVLVGLVGLSSCGSDDDYRTGWFVGKSKSGSSADNTAAGDGGAGLSNTKTTSEACDGVDNNSDGQVDEGCTCRPGAKQNCYTGSAATRNVGVCKDGSQSCVGSGEFGHWGECTGSVRPSDAVQDGKDHDCDGLIDGQSKPSTEICDDGKDNDQDTLVDCSDQDCREHPSCAGAVHADAGGADSGGEDVNAPATEICHDTKDNDGNGKTDCEDPACVQEAMCVAKAQYCNAGGSVYMHDVWYCQTSPDPYAINLTSGLANQVNQGCGGLFGTYGTFSANCAGNYKVCARVISNANQCTVATVCQDVVVAHDGDTVPIPGFPGFGNTQGACANSLVGPYGGQTCLDVTGMTDDHVQVGKQNVDCFAQFYLGGYGTGSGSGGGSY
jgi:hypothetical protein